MNEECAHDAPREPGLVPVECSACGGPPFASLPVTRCARCKGDSRRPPGYEQGGPLWAQTIAPHIRSETHVARVTSSVPAADPFPDVPLRITWREKNRRKRARRRMRRRALLALREARDTLDVLSRSDQALRLRDSALIARAETAEAWRRYVALTDDALDWLDHRVSDISDAASRVRQPAQAAPVPPGALGLAAAISDSRREVL